MKIVTNKEFHRPIGRVITALDNDQEAFDRSEQQALDDSVQEGDQAQEAFEGARQQALDQMTDLYQKVNAICDMARSRGIAQREIIDADDGYVQNEGEVWKQLSDDLITYIDLLE